MSFNVTQSETSFEEKFSPQTLEIVPSNDGNSSEPLAIEKNEHPVRNYLCQGHNGNPCTCTFF